MVDPPGALMPDFEITAPDGRKFIVTAPDGATLLEVVRSGALGISRAPRLGRTPRE